MQFALVIGSPYRGPVHPQEDEQRDAVSNAPTRRSDPGIRGSDVFDSRRSDVNPTERYAAEVTWLLARIVKEEADNIRKAAGMLADVIARDRLIFAFGTGGHSLMGAEEMARRSGGLAAVYPILDPGISVMFSPIRSSALERTVGYARSVLSTYPITPQDVLLIINAYGINACTIDTAMWARERNVPTIAITSPSFSRAMPKDLVARHPNGRNLFELVDLVIDNKMPAGDAVLRFEGLKPPVSPVTTIVNAFVIEALTGETVGLLLERGITPPVWTSSNVPGGDEANEALMTRFSPRIRWL
jgi:uncharacterized phosphosugar-binding protein